MNERKQIIISALSMITFVLLSCCIVYLFDYNSEYKVSDFKISFYDDISDVYREDWEVVKVYKLCRDSDEVSVCVHENIRFVWDDSFESERKYYFFSPTEMAENNGSGVCRDIAVFRMAVFRKLGILAEFVFVPEHVYVRTFEDGKIYELNNEYLIEIE